MKKINTDDSFKQHIIAKFTDYVNKTKFTDSTIHFTTTIDTTIHDQTISKPTVYISAYAYLKMMLYIRDTDTEIAWHGTVERNQEQNWYHIKDVFLYPQIIRSTTVDTDQTKYNEWLENIEDDDIFNNIRFQGHSHVNMGTFPSGTDLNMYDKFLQVLPKNDYYIFMIMNKRGEFNIFIYDLAKNIIYETADINIKVLTPKTQDLLKDIEQDKTNCCEKPTYIPYNATSFQSSYLHDIDRYYGERDLPNYTSRDKIEDINDLIDEIDNKYKNTQLTITKEKKKIKVKGEIK